MKERLGIFDQQKEHDKKTSRWPELRRGTGSELSQLNRQRGFAFAAMHNAESRGLLHFGTQWSCGFWAVTDSRRAMIELRRITGESWRAYGRLPVRKAHCIGTGKNWPIGIIESEPFSKIALCEGARSSRCVRAGLRRWIGDGRPEDVAVAEGCRAIVIRRWLW